MARAEAAIAIYDVTSAASFEAAKTWVAEYVSTLSAAPPRVVLIGNKLDLVQRAGGGGGGGGGGGSGGGSGGGGGDGVSSAANPNDGTTMTHAVAVGTPLGDGAAAEGSSSSGRSSGAAGGGGDEADEDKRSVTRALAQAYADELDGCVRFLEISLKDLGDGDGDGCDDGAEGDTVSQIVEGLVAQVLRTDPDRLPRSAASPSFESLAAAGVGGGASAKTAAAADDDKERLLTAAPAAVQVGSAESSEELTPRPSLGPRQTRPVSSPMQRFMRTVCGCLSPKTKPAP